MTMRSIILLLSYLCWIAVAQASILKGFSTKEVPELKEIPNIAEEVRRLSASGLGSLEATESSSESSSQLFEQQDRILKHSKSSKSKKDEGKSDTGDVTGRQGRNADLEREFPSIPEAPPEFDADGELSFVIVSIVVQSSRSVCAWA
jgi:hypothetical protein